MQILGYVLVLFFSIHLSAQNGHSLTQHIFSKKSLRMYTPPVKSQSYYDTCVGWATAYYGATILKAQSEDFTTKVELEKIALSPLYTYLKSNNANDHNCMFGADIEEALVSLVKEGGILYSEFSSLCADSIPSGLIGLTAPFRLKEFVKLFADNKKSKNKLNPIKNAIINGHPVIVGFDVDHEFRTANGPVYVSQGKYPLGGHSFCLIGFDDERYGGAFEIVNSWGTDWGNKGFLWIRYEDFMTHAYYAYEMIPF